MFTGIIRSMGLPAPVAEHRFAPPRRWRVDFAFPEHKLAIEIEGGYAIQGHHVRVRGFLRDIEKYNTLALHGYALLRFTPRQIQQGEAYKTIKEWFRLHGRDRKGRDETVQN
jgi:very-short-patch-repair endonuclease